MTDLRASAALRCPPPASKKIKSIWLKRRLDSIQYHNAGKGRRYIWTRDARVHRQRRSPADAKGEQLARSPLGTPLGDGRDTRRRWLAVGFRGRGDSAVRG